MQSVVSPPLENLATDVAEYECNNSTVSVNMKRKAPHPPSRGASLKKEDKESATNEAKMKEQQDVQLDNPVMRETSVSADSKHSPDLTGMSKLIRQDSTPSQRRLQHSPISADMVSGRELIDSVREKTGLSYGLSTEAVQTVLLYLTNKLPDVEMTLLPILLSLSKIQEAGSDSNAQDEGSHHDRDRLGVIFSELKDCKDDSQQRSWALYDDYAVILEYLDELLSILGDADPTVCRSMVMRDDYDAVQCLIIYFQMVGILNVFLQLYH
jgi:hypothetical protein